MSENHVSGAAKHVFPPAKLLVAADNRFRATRDCIALLHHLCETASGHASPARTLCNSSHESDRAYLETRPPESASFSPCLQRFQLRSPLLHGLPSPSNRMGSAQTHWACICLGTKRGAD